MRRREEKAAKKGRRGRKREEKTKKDHRDSVPMLLLEHPDSPFITNTESISGKEHIWHQGLENNTPTDFPSPQTTSPQTTQRDLSSF